MKNSDFKHVDVVSDKKSKKKGRVVQSGFVAEQMQAMEQADRFERQKIKRIEKKIQNCDPSLAAKESDLMLESMVKEEKVIKKKPK